MCQVNTALQQRIDQLQQQLNETREQYRDLFHGNHLIVLLINPHTGQIVAANQAAGTFYGYNCTQLVQMNIDQIDTLPRLATMTKIEAAAQRQQSRFQVIHRLAGGALRDVEIVTGPVRYRSQHVIYIMVHDITERLNIERALLNSETRYRELFHHASDMLFLLELDAAGDPLRLLDANHATCSRLGYTQRELLVLSLQDDRIHAAVSAFMAQKSCSSKINVPVNVELVTSEGERFPAEISAHHFLLDGLPVILCIARDVSERERARKRLEASFERYRLLTEHLPDAMITHQGHSILYANQAAVRLLGASHIGDLVGKPIMSIVHGDSQSRVAFRIQQFLDGAPILPLEIFKIIRLDGSISTVEVMTTAFSDQGERVIQLVMRDQTKALREAQRAAIVQMQALDTVTPFPQHFDLDVLYQPLRLISGDFFYLKPGHKGCVMGLLGDVSGHGISAALHNLALKMAFVDALDFAKSPADMLQHLNLTMEKHFPGAYVAACCFQIDLRTGHTRIASAGIACCHHFAPDGSLTELRMDGTPLGMINEANFGEYDLRLGPTERLALFTDGMDEVFRHSFIKREYERTPSIQSQKSALQESMVGLTIHDDCTWVGLTVNGWGEVTDEAGEVVSDLRSGPLSRDGR